MLRALNCGIPDVHLFLVRICCTHDYINNWTRTKSFSFTYVPENQILHVFGVQTDKKPEVILDILCSLFKKILFIDLYNINVNCL